MTPFLTITSRVAWLPEANIDTDIIFPARFLLHTEKEGLGQYAFCDWRLANKQSAPFVLDQPALKQAQVILAGDNFGCGSSREQAPWALADLGIRCIIAPSFGEIFFLNCLQNGILPIVLAESQIAAIMPAVETLQLLTVDLHSQSIRAGDTHLVDFEITAQRRQSLLAGLDEIATILKNFSPAIATFEEAHRRRMPWLYPNPSNI